MATKNESVLDIGAVQVSSETKNLGDLDIGALQAEEAALPAGMSGSLLKTTQLGMDLFGGMMHGH